MKVCLKGYLTRGPSPPEVSLGFRSTSLSSVGRNSIREQNDRAWGQGCSLAWWLLVLKPSLPWCLHVGLLRGANETERQDIAQGPWWQGPCPLCAFAPSSSMRVFSTLLFLPPKKKERKVWYVPYDMAKIMASGPITSWEIDGETAETVSDFIFGGSKITADGDCSHEIKRYLLLGRKVMTNLDSILKSRDITLPTKVRLV